MTNDNHDWHCLECDEICDVSELLLGDDEELLCPSCKSDNIVEL